MDFTEVVRRRHMVRRFTDEPVSADSLDRILRNAVRGPSAGFSQDQEGLALGEPGRRAPHGIAQDPIQALRRDGLVGEPAHHVPAPHDLGEVHCA